MEFKDYLKALRKTKGLTIRQLSLYSGISHTYLSQIETGKRSVPSPEIIRKLANTLQVDYNEMLTVAGYLDAESDKNDRFKTITLEEALQELLNSDHVMFNGLPVGELDEETKEDLKTAVLAIMEYKAKHGTPQQQPKKAAAAARRNAMVNGGAILLSAAAS